MAKDSLDKKNIPSQHNDEITDTSDITLTPDATVASLPAPTIISEVPGQAAPSERRQVVKSASLVMLGNLGSSVMGMVRQVVVASTGSAVAGPFTAALLPAQTFYDFLINGSVSGALIPTFNDYSAPEKRDELRRLVFTIVNLVLIIVFAIAVLFALFSPYLINFLVGGFPTQVERDLTLQFARIIFFSLVALCPFSVLLAALYALKEFGWPAFATVSYHVGIIIGAIVGSIVGERYQGHLGLAFGVLLGALGEIALLFPGIRKQRLWYMPALDLKHPALRRILRLYAPVALSFLVTMALVFFDQHLVSLALGNGAANTAAQKFATTLIQFPIGLVAAALSFAVLPSLSTYVREGDNERFKEMLLLGFRLGLLLMIPAAAGLIVLKLPIVKLIFEHHKYTSADALLTATALQNYAYQLPFVAMDQLLIAAFYARKNTIIPVVVGFVSILGYLVVAIPFSRTVGIAALAFANTVQNSSHAIILLVLLRMAIGPMHIRQMVPTVLKILIATVVLVAVAWAVQFGLAATHISFLSIDTLIGQFITVILAGGLAVLAFLSLVLALKVEEIGLLKGAVLAKLGKK